MIDYIPVVFEVVRDSALGSIALTAAAFGALAGDAAAELRQANVKSARSELRPTDILAEHFRKTRHETYALGEATVVYASASLSGIALATGLEGGGDYGAYPVSKGVALAVIATLPIAAVVRREILNRQGSRRIERSVHPTSYRMALRNEPPIPGERWVAAGPDIDLRAPLAPLPNARKPTPV